MRDVLIRNFLRISEIPRSSGNEGKIADFFVQVPRIIISIILEIKVII